jgi:hypothetical protein
MLKMRALGNVEPAASNMERCEPAHAGNRSGLAIGGVREPRRLPSMSLKTRVLTAALSSVMTLFSVLSAPSAPAAEPQSRLAARAIPYPWLRALIFVGQLESERQSYLVWKTRQRVHVVPKGYSSAAWVTKGQVLEIVEREGDWTRVEFELDGVRKAGWSILTPKELSAGERAESLRDTTTSSVAMAAKTLDEILLVDSLARRTLPEAAKKLESLESASLSEKDVEAFLRAGKLRAKSRR